MACLDVLLIVSSTSRKSSMQTLCYFSWPLLKPTADKSAVSTDLPWARSTLWRILHSEVFNWFGNPRSLTSWWFPFCNGRRYCHRRSHSFDQFLRENDRRQNPVFKIDGRYCHSQRLFWVPIVADDRYSIPQLRVSESWNKSVFWDVHDLVHDHPLEEIEGRHLRHHANPILKDDKNPGEVFGDCGVRQASLFSRAESLLGPLAGRLHRRIRNTLSLPFLSLREFLGPHPWPRSNRVIQTSSSLSHGWALLPIGSMFP